MQFLCLSVSSLIPAVRVLFCINGLAYLLVRGTLLCISWPSSTASGAEKLLLVFIGLCSFVSHSLQHCSHVIHPSLARKRTGDAEIGWRPAPEKNIEAMPCWGKNTSWTWDVTHERALSPADLFGGKAPVGALIGLLERIFWRICSSSAFCMCLCDCCVLAFLCFWERIN